MSIEVDLPRDIELTLKANRELDLLVRRRIEHEISKDIKDGLFLAMSFDNLLKESEIQPDDIDKIDHEIKRGVLKRLEWR